MKPDFIKNIFLFSEDERRSYCAFTPDTSSVPNLCLVICLNTLNPFAHQTKK